MLSIEKAGSYEFASIQLPGFTRLWYFYGSAPVAPADDNSLTEQERSEGWILLFDGVTTKGWMTCTSQPLPSQHVQNGCLNPHPCDYMLVHAKLWENFQLSLDVKISPKCNSGIFIRTFPLTPRPGLDRRRIARKSEIGINDPLRAHLREIVQP